MVSDTLKILKELCIDNAGCGMALLLAQTLNMIVLRLKRKCVDFIFEKMELVFLLIGELFVYKCADCTVEKFKVGLIDFIKLLETLLCKAKFVLDCVFGALKYINGMVTDSLEVGNDMEQFTDILGNIAAQLLRGDCNHKVGYIVIEPINKLLIVLNRALV